MKKNCYRRKDGRWQYSKQENGFLYYTIANTYRELIARIPNITPRPIRGVSKTKTTANTFLQYFNFFIDTYIKGKEYRSDTIRLWQNYSKNYIATFFSRLPLEKLTHEKLQKFIYSIKKERTRQLLTQCVIRVLRKAYVTGKLKKDLSLGLEIPKRKEKQERPPLTLDEQKRFLEKAKQSKIYAFIMFSLIVGSRRSETLRFNLDTDINEEKMLLHINGTKTANAERYVKITPAFVQLLKDNMKKKKFVHTDNYYTKEVGRIFTELKIENCLHGLRHTCSANLYFLGAKDKYRQMQLGHSSIVITNDIYTNIKENIEKADLLDLYGDLYPNFD